VATTSGGANLAAWVQLGPGKEISARAITNDFTCPTLQVNGAPVAMRTRSDPAALLGNTPSATFPVRGCEAVVPFGTAMVLLDDQRLPLLPPRELRRIVVIGDTGCRLKGAFGVQDCNDPDAWPYAKIVAHAVEAHPDLVLHIGDYHYRETACPAGRAGCQASPFGFGWDAWNADFFQPSAPLFAAAPWLLVRGNHEDCDRAGEGWFRFLAAAPMPERCTDLTGFFVSKPRDMGFVIMDGAKAVDEDRDPATLIETLRRQLGEVRDDIPVEAWLITHRPMNAMRSAIGTGPDTVENRIQQAAIGDRLPPGVRIVVSGHNHFFQALDFAGARPPQLVVGTGGNRLVPIPREALVGKEVNGARVAAAAARYGYGYMVWDKTEFGWEGALFDENGSLAQRCRLVERKLTCE
jgi:Calcineurin-like phosphoesterase